MEGKMKSERSCFFWLIPEHEHFEPKNEGLVQMIFLQTGDFQVPSISCPGCMAFLCVFFWSIKLKRKSSTSFFWKIGEKGTLEN